MFNDKTLSVCSFNYLMDQVQLTEQDLDKHLLVCAREGSNGSWSNNMAVVSTVMQIGTPIMVTLFCCIICIYKMY